jgi:probable addiction module antidote protein
MTNFTPWDSAELLSSKEDVVAYLNAVFEDAAETNDHSLIPHALGAIARAKGMTDIARETGLSRESLYKALSEDGNPSFATVMKVLQALSIELRTKTKSDEKSDHEAA